MKLGELLKKHNFKFSKKYGQNFLSDGNLLESIAVKGGVDKDKIASGIKIIMTNPRVEGILLNILGGFVRCNLIADGIVAAASEVGLNVPMVIRFEGTNKDIAREILDNSRLPIIWADSMEESVEKLVKAIEEAA